MTETVGDRKNTEAQKSPFVALELSTKASEARVTDARAQTPLYHIPLD